MSHNIKRPCKHCGKEFVGTHAGKLFCSDKCTKAAQLKQRLEWQAKNCNILTRWNANSKEYLFIKEMAVKHYKSPGQIVKSIVIKYIREREKVIKEENNKNENGAMESRGD